MNLTTFSNGRVASALCVLAARQRASDDERPRASDHVLLPYTSRHRQLARETRRRNYPPLLISVVLFGCGWPASSTFRRAAPVRTARRQVFYQANNVYRLNFLCTPADVGQEENRSGMRSVRGFVVHFHFVCAAPRFAARCSPFTRC